MAMHEQTESGASGDLVQRLRLGNARFVAGERERVPQPALAEGQAPYAVVLSCSDSRVVPEHIFDAAAGELFTIRVAGNVANTSTVASVEYAVAVLGSPLIVVLAHQSCGAVAAAIDGGRASENLAHLLDHIHPAIAEAGLDAAPDDVAKVNANRTARELVARSSIIRAAVDAGDLAIVVGFYQLASGEVTGL
jgi:carbonic anhydrase